MGILTIRMRDNTHDRLKQLAKSRGISVNKLMEEVSTAALVEFDAETRFRTRARRGKPSVGLRLLDKIDRASKRRK
jgi:hypothetical protein